METRQRLVMARLGRADHRWICLFMGVKRSCRFRARNDANDPKRRKAMSARMSVMRDKLAHCDFYPLIARPVELAPAPGTCKQDARFNDEVIGLEGPHALVRSLGVRPPLPQQ